MSFATWMASPSESTASTATNGTNSSCFQIHESRGTCTTAGATKFPRARSPSVSRSAPVMTSPFFLASAAASS